MQVNAEQFKQWVKQHNAALYRHAWWMTGSKELAKDLVQDTFFQAWKYRTSLREENKALAWLITILRRLVYKESANKTQHSLSPEEMLSESNSDLLLTPNNNTDEIIDLTRQLNSLNSSQREILLLYALHGFTYEEIAEQLEIPQGTVMSRISRARKAMNIEQLHDKKTTSIKSNIIQFNENNR